MNKKELEKLIELQKRNAKERYGSKEKTKRKFDWKKLKKLLINISGDISYWNGGWAYFIIRMGTNGIILYYVLHFLYKFFEFIFGSVGIVGQNVETVRTLLWAFGIVFLVMRCFIFPFKDSEKRFDKQ